MLRLEIFRLFFGIFADLFWLDLWLVLKNKIIGRESFLHGCCLTDGEVSSSRANQSVWLFEALLKYLRVIQKRETTRKTEGATIIVTIKAPKKADELSHKGSQTLIIETRPIIPYCFAVSQDIEASLTMNHYTYWQQQAVGMGVSHEQFIQDRLDISHTIWLLGIDRCEKVFWANAGSS